VLHLSSPTGGSLVSAASAVTVSSPVLTAVPSVVDAVVLSMVGDDVPRDSAVEVDELAESSSEPQLESARAPLARRAGVAIRTGVRRRGILDLVLRLVGSPRAHRPGNRPRAPAA